MTQFHVFDGHNDLLSRLAGQQCYLHEVKQGITAPQCKGHLDLPRAHQGGFGGGLFAMFVDDHQTFGNVLQAMEHPPYHLPLPAPLEYHFALSETLHQAALLHRLQHQGVVQICTTVSEITQVMARGDQLAAVLHLEGAEAIDQDFHVLEVLYAAGLRSLGPVWSRPNHFGHGVPFAYPADADIGLGLTDQGIALLKACNEWGIMFDVSHLNAQGFWDVKQHTQAPIVASHSNAAAICRHSRNLSDDQLRAIAESNGLVGINFAAATLREDGISTMDTSLEAILRHLEHLLKMLGEDRVALGSDFDGAIIPAVIGDCTGLPRLFAFLQQHGYDEIFLQKLASTNWLALLARVWRPASGLIQPAD